MAQWVQKADGTFSRQTAAQALKAALIEKRDLVYRSILKEAIEKYVVRTAKGWVIRSGKTESRPFETFEKAADVFKAGLDAGLRHVMDHADDDEEQPDTTATHLPPDQMVQDGTFDADPALSRERARAKLDKARSVRLL